jgi:hypothetical protein
MDMPMMMESMAIMISMDMTMETLLENVDSHMLFAHIYIFNHLNKQMIFSFLPIPPVVLAFTFKKKPFYKNFTIMFLSPALIFDPTIYPFTDKSYPPTTLVKHHTWFLSTADLFISLNNILYGIHQFYFNQSPIPRCSKKLFIMEKPTK